MFSVTQFVRVFGTTKMRKAVTEQKSENQAYGTSARCFPMPCQRYCV